MNMWGEVVLLLGFGVISAVCLSDAELHHLPRLFYLDDYERCLARPGSLYCMGSFRLTPAVTPHHMYDVLKEYSMRKDLFNRTLLHRGYCVTTRCSEFNHTSTTSDSERFEACVQKWARPLQLKTSLETLNYCRSPNDRLVEMKEAQKEHSMHNLLLQITYAVLVMNLVGTLYDLMLDDEAGKNKFLTIWSVRNNWRRLMADFNPGPDRRYTAFKSIEGVRVFMLVVVLLFHVIQAHFTLYTANPSFLERASEKKVSVILRNASPIVQVFIMIASFLFTYKKLVGSQKQRLSFMHTPKDIATRIARILPSYFMVLLFASSWWPLLNDGPMWQMAVAKENKICKRKFWYHLFFINNYMEPTSHCIEQSWFLAVEMQLRLIASIVTHAIAIFSLQPLKLLSKMFLGSCLLNVTLCYIFETKTVLFGHSAENWRTLFKDHPASTIMYTSTWGSLPACILGMYVAHKHFYEEAEGKKIQHSKLFLNIASMAIPLVMGWILLGSLFMNTENKLVIALYSGLERPIFTLLCAVKLYACCKRILDGPIRRVLSSLEFCVLGRLSLSALLLHWCVLMFVVAGRPTVFYTNSFEIFVDTTTTWVCTYALAVPLTLLLEMPAYRSISMIL